MHFNHICECSRLCSSHGNTVAQDDVATMTTWLLLLKARFVNLDIDYVVITAIMYICTYNKVFNLRQIVAKSDLDAVGRHPRPGAITHIAYRSDWTVRRWHTHDTRLYRVLSTICCCILSECAHLWLLWWRAPSRSLKMKANLGVAWKNHATNYADDVWLHGSLCISYWWCMQEGTGGMATVAVMLDVYAGCIDVSKQSISHSHRRWWDACQELRPLNTLHHRAVSRKCFKSYAYDWKISSAPTNCMSQLSDTSIGAHSKKVCYQISQRKVKQGVNVPPAPQ